MFVSDTPEDLAIIRKRLEQVGECNIKYGKKATQVTACPRSRWANSKLTLDQRLMLVLS